MLDSVIKYYKLVYKFAGYRLFVLTFASLISGILDGVGLTMLLPLLQSSEFNSLNNDTPEGIMYLFKILGVPAEFESVLVVMAVIFILKMAAKFIEGALQSRIVS